jgi:hypothetical protein
MRNLASMLVTVGSLLFGAPAIGAPAEPVAALDQTAASVRTDGREAFLTLTVAPLAKPEHLLEVGEHIRRALVVLKRDARARFDWLHFDIAAGNGPPALSMAVEADILGADWPSETPAAALNTLLFKSTSPQGLKLVASTCRDRPLRRQLQTFCARAALHGVK